jgi:putative flippase GtrA
VYFNLKKLIVIVDRFFHSTINFIYLCTDKETLLKLFLMEFFTKERFFQLFRFGIVGVIATVIHYGVYWVFLKWLNPTYAYSIGYAVSFVFNFFLSSFFTFKIRPDIKKGYRFALSHGINYLLHISFLNMFLYLGIPKAFAPFPVFVLVVPINFILVHTALTHNKKNEKNINSDSGF